MVNRQYIEAWLSAGEIIEGKIDKLASVTKENGDPQEAFRKMYYGLPTITDAEMKQCIAILNKKRANIASNNPLKIPLGEFLSNAQIILMTAADRAEAVKLMKREGVLPDDAAERERIRLVEERRRQQQEQQRREEERRRREEEERRRREEEERRRRQQQQEEQRRREEDQRRRQQQQETQRRQQQYDTVGADEWVAKAAQNRRLFLEKQKKNWLKRIPWKWIIILLLVIAAIWGLARFMPFISLMMKETEYHTVLVKKTQLRDVPKVEDGNYTYEITAGTEVEIDEEMSNLIWSYVKVKQNDQVGYVATNTLVSRQVYGQVESIFNLPESIAMDGAPIFEEMHDDVLINIAKFFEEYKIWGCSEDSIKNVYGGEASSNSWRLEYEESETKNPNFYHFKDKDNLDYTAIIFRDITNEKRITMVFWEGDNHAPISIEDAPKRGGIRRVTWSKGAPKIRYEVVSSTKKKTTTQPVTTQPKEEKKTPEAPSNGNTPDNSTPAAQPSKQNTTTPEPEQDNSGGGFKFEKVSDSEKRQLGV